MAAVFGVKLKPLVRRYLGEFMATFMLTYAINGIFLNLLRSTESHRLVTMGLAVVLVSTPIVAAFIEASGSNITPLFTLASWLLRRKTTAEAMAYWLVQFLANVAADLMLVAVFPSDSKVIQALSMRVGEGIQWYEAVLAEFMLSFILVLIYAIVVIKNIPSSSNSKTSLMTLDAPTLATAINRPHESISPFYISMVFGFLTMLHSSICGGAFNPFRSIVPALLTFDFKDVWVYVVSDLAGTGVAALVVFLVFE